MLAKSFFGLSELLSVISRNPFRNLTIRQKCHFFSLHSSWHHVHVFLLERGYFILVLSQPIRSEWHIVPAAQAVRLLVAVVISVSWPTTTCTATPISSTLFLSLFFHGCRYSAIRPWRSPFLISPAKLCQWDTRPIWRKVKGLEPGYSRGSKGLASTGSLLASVFCLLVSFVT